FADVFRNLRVSFAEFARFTADSPWTLSRRTTDEIKFYAVLHGNCGMQLAHGVRVKLARGDLVVLPHGTSHELTGESPGLGERQERADAFGVVGSRASPSAAARPPRVELVSGRLGLEHPHPMHWWALLPNVVVARTGANTLPWLESTLAFITGRGCCESGLCGHDLTGPSFPAAVEEVGPHGSHLAGTLLLPTHSLALETLTGDVEVGALDACR